MYVFPKTYSLFRNEIMEMSLWAREAFYMAKRDKKNEFE